MTFLFSDIEGSTQRWEAHPEEMKAAVKRHEQILSDAIVHRGGYVFKSLGDAFCAAFKSTHHAIAAAIDAQRALAKEDFSGVDGLRVRMGLHTGTAEERNDDYFGPTVNRVARLMSIGHGGQVLVSGLVAHTLDNALPSGVILTDLGLRRLKDLTQPEQVWQLSIADLPGQFPPLNSLDARANNLPIQATTLIGREQDLEEVKALLIPHRLLTLFGAGGVGKTRLALQVGADLLDRYPDGAWFIDLAPIGDAELVASVIAKTIGMTQSAGQRLDEAIPMWLKQKKLLLVLDNCEHLLEAVATIAEAIIRGCPGVKILATSREALGIGGEVVHRLPSLAVPDSMAGLRALEAVQYGSIALFIDRARAVDTRFSLTDETAPVVADICRRLDGIPLAIELAAARVKVLSIPSLARRLDERFKILTGGSRTGLPRQKTLGALIDWSYNLLTAHEQTLFNRVGIFAGGFSLEAATTVCDGDRSGQIDVLDVLSSLNDKSLITADTSGEHERYRLLESTRAYALDKLTAAGERQSMARRHAEYFRDEALSADERYGTGSTFAWLAHVELELDNYRAALERALTQGHDPLLGGAIAGALDSLWYRGGLFVEGRYWIGRALELLNEEEHPWVVGRLILALSFLSSGKRKYEEAVRSTLLFESIGDSRWAARARSEFAFGLYQMGRLEEACDEMTRALAESRACRDERRVAGSLAGLAFIKGVQGDLSAGRDLLAQALAAFEVLGDETAIAVLQGNLAELEFADGHPDQALRLVTDSLEIDLRGKNLQQVGSGYINSAAYLIALGDSARARESAREGLRWVRQQRAELKVAWALQHLAVISGLGDDVRRAARLLGYVDVQYKALGLEREPTEKWGHEKLIFVLREKLREDEIARYAAEGAAWSEDQAVEEALKV